MTERFPKWPPSRMGHVVDIFSAVIIRKDPYQLFMRKTIKNLKKQNLSIP